MRRKKGFGTGTGRSDGVDYGYGKGGHIFCAQKKGTERAQYFSASALSASHKPGGRENEDKEIKSL